MTPVVLDCRRSDDGFYVIVRDDYDACPLHETNVHGSIPEALAAARDELLPSEQEVGVMLVEEV